LIRTWSSAVIRGVGTSIISIRRIPVSLMALMAAILKYLFLHPVPEGENVSGP